MFISFFEPFGLAKAEILQRATEDFDSWSSVPEGSKGFNKTSGKSSWLSECALKISAQ